MCTVYVQWPVKSDNNKRLFLLSVIQFSGWHCNCIFQLYESRAVSLSKPMFCRLLIKYYNDFVFQFSLKYLRHIFYPFRRENHWGLVSCIDLPSTFPLDRPPSQREQEWREERRYKSLSSRKKRMGQKNYHLLNVNLELIVFDQKLA